MGRRLTETERWQRSVEAQLRARESIRYTGAWRVKEGRTGTQRGYGLVRPFQGVYGGERYQMHSFYPTEDGARRVYYALVSRGLM